MIDRDRLLLWAAARGMTSESDLVELVRSVEKVKVAPPRGGWAAHQQHILDAMTENVQRKQREIRNQRERNAAQARAQYEKAERQRQAKAEERKKPKWLFTQERREEKQRQRERAAREHAAAKQWAAEQKVLADSTKGVV